MLLLGELGAPWAGSGGLRGVSVMAAGNGTTTQFSSSFISTSSQESHILFGSTGSELCLKQGGMLVSPPERKILDIIYTRQAFTLKLFI